MPEQQNLDATKSATIVMDVDGPLSARQIGDYFRLFDMLYARIVLTLDANPAVVDPTWAFQRPSGNSGGSLSPRGQRAGLLAGSMLLLRWDNLSDLSKLLAMPDSPEKDAASFVFDAYAAIIYEKLPEYRTHRPRFINSEGALNQNAAAGHLQILELSMQSPLKYVAVGIPLALVLAVIFSGGSVKLGVFEATVPPIGTGITAIRQALADPPHTPSIMRGISEANARRLAAPSMIDNVTLGSPP